jgi:hypothetical protein
MVAVYTFPIYTISRKLGAAFSESEIKVYIRTGIRTYRKDPIAVVGGEERRLHAARSYYVSHHREHPPELEIRAMACHSIRLLL